MIAAGWVLLVLAGLMALAGGLQAALFLAICVGILALVAPDDDHVDARRRNRARRWQ